MAAFDLLLIQRNVGGGWEENVIAAAVNRLLGSDEDGAPLLLTVAQVKALLDYEIGDIPGLTAALAGLMPIATPGQFRASPSDGSLQLWNAEQNLWFSLAVAGAAGDEVLTIVTPGEA